MGGPTSRKDVGGIEASLPSQSGALINIHIHARKLMLAFPPWMRNLHICSFSAAAQKAKSPALPCRHSSPDPASRLWLPAIAASCSCQNPASAVLPDCLSESSLPTAPNVQMDALRRAGIYPESLL